jgi:hypothetical protein
MILNINFIYSRIYKMWVLMVIQVASHNLFKTVHNKCNQHRIMVINNNKTITVMIKIV